jgi:hypothetical protein
MKNRKEAEATLSAQQRKEPAAQQRPIPNWCSLSSPPHRHVGPICQAMSSSPSSVRRSCRRLFLPPVNPPSSIPVNARPFHSRAAPIRPPHLPLHSSPSLSPDCAPRLLKLLAEPPHICRLLRPISLPLVTLSTPYSSRHLPSTWHIPLTPFLALFYSQSSSPELSQSTSSPHASPVGALLLLRKQSTTPTKFSSSPCLPDHRRGIAAIQNPPEARRSSTSGRISGDLAGNLAP